MQKRGFLFHSPAMLTWRVADVARGTRTDATRQARPRGRAARARLRRKWRTGHGHVARGHMVHADAREGRHVAGGLASEGPTGLWALVG